MRGTGWAGTIGAAWLLASCGGEVGRANNGGWTSPSTSTWGGTSSTPSGSTLGTGIGDAGSDAPAPSVRRIPDTDGDGVDDATDECPDEPEDRDRFQDDDGCIDPDDDGDEIRDIDDGCPAVPEDRDRFEDDDGCPEPGGG